MEQADHPIHRAARKGNLSKVQRLVTEDPSLIEARGKARHTPLTSAAMRGRAAIVEWLVDHAEANIDAQAAGGATGLYMGSFGGHLEVVSILVNRGGDINRTDAHGGWSPLMVAAYIGHVGLVELLLSQESINLDARDGGGRTALWYPSDEGRKKVIGQLLVAGADPRIATNDDGRTPLDVAREKGHDGCIRLLEAALAERERAHLLHRARAINDAHHAINNVATGSEGMNIGLRRKRKMVAAAPAYLERRVREGKELPQVEVRERHEKAEKEKLAAVTEIC